MIRIAIALTCACTVSSSLNAMVGGAPPADKDTGGAVIMLTGSHGTFCSGVALTRDLVLTAAHCVLPGASYKVIEFDGARQPMLKDLATIATHPDFDVNAVLRHRVTADVALVKLAAPLKILPAPLAPDSGSVARPGTASWWLATALRFAATARPAAPCAPPRWSPPGSPAPCKSGSPIPPPKASAPGSAPAPAIQARRSIAPSAVH
jgi:hypothetical protein